MTHPAINFLDLLDPSPEARFNIETYTDKKDKPKPDLLSKRFLEQTRDQIEMLLPELETINKDGAAIYVAVNEFTGQRKIDNLYRVRGIHADLDHATEEQLQNLHAILTPTIVVQSSVGTKQHWYWLLTEGEELEADTANALNKGLVKLGADKAAVDVTRLLRLPGFRHMKSSVKVGDNRECAAELEACPLVKVIEHGPRYTVGEILNAFSARLDQRDRSKTTPGKIAADGLRPENRKVNEAVAYLKAFEPQLWEGRWQDYEDPLTHTNPFSSQSEADYHLARRLAYWAAHDHQDESDLQAFVEAVFEQSGLAQRSKWQDRQDYRASTIQRSCAGVIAPDRSTTVTTKIASTAQPDWSLRGDLIGARFFRDRYAGAMVFVVSIGKWLRWSKDDHKWLWCELGEHIEAAKETVLELHHLAMQNGATNPDAWKSVISMMAALQTEARIKAMLELAKSEQNMSILPEELDAHADLVGVRNGIVDLRTGTLRKNEPSLYITKYIVHDYVPGAACPTFKRFLNDVFLDDEITIDAIHRLLGLTLTGRTDEEVIVFCIGKGANGKSIFGNIVSAIMGAHSTVAPSSLLASRRNDDHSARSDLAMLHGARLVSINELPGGMMLDENITKQLAGREPISARYLYKEHFTFLPRFTPWVRTNHRPIIKGTDNGIWRRMVIVPFNRTFTVEEQDTGLEPKLLAEANGILAWMVAGAKLYLKDGFRNSPAMKSELANYRSDSDLLGEFLSDRTNLTPTAETKQSDLYLRYKIWCDSNGLRPVTKRALNEQLSERGIGQRKSGSARYYTGVELRSMSTD